MAGKLAGRLSADSLSSRLPLFSLAIASASALAYEILLTRLFAIIHWHHFAYMIISLALLGYGLSGTVLAFAWAPLTRRFKASYPICLGLFAVAIPASFLLAQAVDLHPEALLWRPGLYWRLPLVYLLLSVPFFFIALAIAILLTRFSERAGTIYSVDLAGAGAGSIAVIVLLFALLPQSVIWVLTAVAAMATLISLWELRRLQRAAVGLAVLALLLPMLLPAHWMRLNISPFKGLEQTLQVSGAELLATRSSPLGLISVVKNDSIPLRYAPGLSLASRASVPGQLAVFTDAESLTTINGWSGRRDDLQWLDDSPAALPYHLINARSVLIAGAGGGTELLRALGVSGTAGRLPQLDVLELNAQLVQLVSEEYRGFSGDLYQQPGVHVYSQELRGFLARSSRLYDLISLPTPGGPGGTSGLSALGENYQLTVEAFAEYLLHIDQNGYVASPSWLQLPPRDTLKLLATAVAALTHIGVADPSSRILMIRGWQTAELLVKGSAVTDADIAATRAFCRSRGFDLVLYPGMSSEEANRTNRLPEPVFHEAAVALANDRDQAFISDYGFNIAPATDDRPYFFQFFRWRSLSEILGQKERGGLGMLESGYVILIASLVQAFAVSLLLVLLPLAFARRGERRAFARWRGRAVGYFSLLGLAFMFLEVAFIQKFLLVLHHPVYAVTTVLATFLVCAGIGSGSTGYLVRRWGRRALPGVVAGIMLLGLLYIALLPLLHLHTSQWPLALRMLLAIVLLAPLAFLMGIPFPLGLMRLGSVEEGAVPWAWAINGCASVTGVILATVVAMHWGFSTIVVLALGMYLACACVAPREVLTRP